VKTKITLVAVAFVLLAFGFIAGVVTVVHQVYPAWLVALPDQLRDFRRHWRSDLGIEPTRYLQTARQQGSGVVTHTPRASQNELTLISSIFDDQVGVLLIDMDGETVHFWPVPFDDVFADTSGVQRKSEIPQNDWSYTVRGAALSDGSLLAIVGPMLVKLDKCGALLWAKPEHAHHMIFPNDDGTFWAPSTRWYDRPPQFWSSASDMRDDLLVKFSADGEVLQRISLLEVIFENNLYHILAAIGHQNPLAGGGFASKDPAHINDVEVLSEPQARHVPGAAAGDLMVSARNLNLVIIFDPVSYEVRWWQVGPWLWQHDPDIAPDGRMTVFDNNRVGRRRAMGLGGSAIVAMDPLTRQVEPIFPTDQTFEFYSHCCGMHQHLENGNILITVQQEGRIIEVSPGGDVVWEYLLGYDETHVRAVYDGARYAASWFDADAFQCDGEQSNSQE